MKIRWIFCYCCFLFQLLFEHKDERYVVNIPMKTIIDKYVMFNDFPSILGLSCTDYSSYKHYYCSSSAAAVKGFFVTVREWL